VSLNADLLRASFALAVSRRPDFTDRFYSTLFERHPALRALFAHTTPAAQARMLEHALSAVLEHIEDTWWLAGALHRLGERHVGYGVTDEMYDQVGDALLATFAEVLGAAWTPEIAEQWTQAYQAVSGMMRPCGKKAAAA
jgi:hemoglobin-like flavoprotein